MANVKISNLPTETDVENIQGVAGYRTNTNSGELETVQFGLGPLKTSNIPGLKSGSLLIESTFGFGGGATGQPVAIELKTNANSGNEGSILISSDGGGTAAALKLRSKRNIQVDLHSQNSSVSAPTAGNFLIAKDADGNLEWSDKTFSNVPTNNDQLTNGAGYITSADVPTTIDWTSVNNKPATFAPIIGTGATDAMAGDTTIPTNNDQLTNGAGYITSVPVIDLSDSTQVTGILPIANGGTGQNTYSVGDILYADTSSTLAKLPASATSGHVLTSNGAGAAPSYQLAPGSGKMVSTASFQGWKEVGGYASSTTNFGVPMATWGVGGSGTGGRKDLGFWVAPFACTVENFEGRWGHNAPFDNGGNNPVVGLYKITAAAWTGSLDIGNSANWGSALQKFTIPSTGQQPNPNANDYWKLTSTGAAVSLAAGDAIAIFMNETPNGGSDPDGVIWLFVNYTYS
jgi:hypothetical protein